MIGVLGACSPPAPELTGGVLMPVAAIERPNLILISIDTLRADYLGCYGYGRDTSPALDALAAGGTRFDDAIAASPWTLPSHATMLSGLYPSRHGVLDHNFELTAPTLALLLRAAGYQTMAIVNTKNIGGERFGLMRGYDQKHYELEQPLVTEADGVQRPLKNILNSGKAITRRAQSWIDGRDPKQPFFMFLHFYDVHTDLTPDPEWREKFVGEYHGQEQGTTLPLVKVRNGKRSLDAADVQWLKEMYAAEIRTFDDVLAKFVLDLEAKGLIENTVLAITSDHGEEFYEHGSVLHGRTYYEEQTRIPLILHGPGIPRGFCIEQPVHLIDVAPTLLSLAGLEAPPMDGIDLTRAWLVGGALDPGRVLLAEADHNNIVHGRDISNIGRMLRKNEYKLIYDTITGRKELYNLELDPLELNNLAEVESERAEALYQELQVFMAGSIAGRDIGPLEATDKALLKSLGYGGDDEADEEE